MSRIRSIKPDFFRHEGLQDLESAHSDLRPMLVFAGLWTACDKQGVFPWKPRQLHLDILPFLDFDFAASLAALEHVDFIRHFVTPDGKEFGYIPTFREHQRISGEEDRGMAKFPDPTTQVFTPSSDPHKPHAGATQEPTTSVGGSCPGKGKGNGVGSRDITGSAKNADPVTPDDPFGAFGIEPDTLEPIPKQPTKATTPKPPVPDDVDPLYRPIWESCLSQAGQFTNYAKEGSACKRLCELIRTRKPEAPEVVAKGLLETFVRLRSTGNKFWAGQPFTPSALASAGIFDRLWVEYEHDQAWNDTSWVDETPRKEIA